jgi:hypothetical protein
MNHDEARIGMNESSCRNCGEALAGAFCASCGQRRFRAQDRRLGHLLGEALGVVDDVIAWRGAHPSLAQDWFVAQAALARPSTPRQTS